MRALDWLARTIFLILAGSATLALIGSLASVSDSALSEAVPGRIGTDRAVPDDGREGVPPPDSSSTVATRSTEDHATLGSAPAEQATPAAVSADAREVARWLKALTYAVLALAGFAAAGLVALIRIAARLGRIAGR